MRRILASLLAAIAVSGCGAEKAPQPAPAAPDAAERAAALPIDIGDVEAALYVQGRPAAPAANVAVENRTTIDNKIRMTTIHVDPPAPMPFLFEFRVTAETGLLRDAAAAVHCTVFREVNGARTPLKSFGAVVRGYQLPAADKPADTFQLDALAGLEDVPESMLLHVEGRLVLLPPDADLSSVDPAAVSAPEHRVSSALRANPIRIHFAPEPPAS